MSKEKIGNKKKEADDDDEMRWPVRVSDRVKIISEPLEGLDLSPVIP